MLCSAVNIGYFAVKNCVVSWNFVLCRETGYCAVSLLCCAVIFGMPWQLWATVVSRANKMPDFLKATAALADSLEF